MTQSKLKTERMLFENWAARHGFDIRRVKEDYADADTNDAWFAWLARAELED